jgi:arginine decarboxylase
MLGHTPCLHESSPWDDPPRLRLAHPVPSNGRKRQIDHLLAKSSVLHAVASLAATDRWSTPSILGAAKVVADEVSVSSAAQAVNGKPLGTFAGKGVFSDSCDLAAALYGADEALTLTYGSTLGNQLVAKLLKRRHERVLIAANSHHSVINACVDCGVEFSRVAFGYDPAFEAAMPPTAATLGAALRRHPDATAVWLSLPTYEGATPDDMQEMAAIVHDAGAIFVVDAAWGAHHPFHPALPPFPMTVGADIAVTSLHKTGGAAQGAALLLINNERVNEQDVRAVHDDRASTSPSLNILASIDEALRELARQGTRHLDRTFHEIAALRDGALMRLPSLDVWSPPDGSYADPGRVTFSIANYGISGYEVRDRLVQLGIAPEKAGLRTITFLCPFQLRSGAAQRAIDALAAVLGACEAVDAPTPLGDPLEAVCERPLVDPGQITRLAALNGKRVPLEHAAGLIAAESAELFPPGVSLLVPGFPIQRDAIRHLLAAEAHGGQIAMPGGFDGSVLTVDRRALGR